MSQWTYSQQLFVEPNCFCDRDALPRRSASAAPRRRFERVRQTVTSAANLEKIVRSTRIGDTVTNAGQMERAVKDLAEDIKIVGDEKNVFQITATSGRGDFSDAANASLAQDIAQRLIDIFREENLGAPRRNRGTIEFLDRQC